MALSNFTKQTLVDALTSQAAAQNLYDTIDNLEAGSATEILATYADATARDAAITSPTTGQTVLNLELGVQSYTGSFWRTPSRPVALDLGAVGYWVPDRGINVADGVAVPAWLDRAGGYSMAEATTQPDFNADGGPFALPSVDFTAANTDVLSNAHAAFDDWSAFSYCAWIYTAGGVAQGIIAKGDYEKALSLNSNDYLSLDVQYTGTDVDYVGNVAITASTWVHVAVTHSSAGTALYIDGVESTYGVSTDPDAGAAITADATSAFYLGLASASSFNGRMGPVAAFNKQLTAAEVLALAKEVL